MSYPINKAAPDRGEREPYDALSSTTFPPIHHCTWEASRAQQAAGAGQEAAAWQQHFSSSCSPSGALPTRSFAAHGKKNLYASAGTPCHEWGYLHLTEQSFSDNDFCRHFCALGSTGMIFWGTKGSQSSGSDAAVLHAQGSGTAPQGDNGAIQATLD